MHNFNEIQNKFLIIYHQPYACVKNIHIHPKYIKKIRELITLFIKKQYFILRISFIYNT